MGCDIHFFVEKKINGIWHQQFVLGAETEWDKKYWFSGRSYWLFGLLAGVRGDHFKPLTDPRGLPNDLSDDLKNEWERWRGDGHTPSYYSLPELLEARDKTVTLTGYVDIKGYREYLRGGYPDGFSFTHYDYPNRQTRHLLISNQQMDRIVKMLAFLGDTEYYTEIIWEQPIRQICPSFWDDLSKIEKLDYDPNNIRCVFWFDN
jgi:hypothetical protein